MQDRKWTYKVETVKLSPFGGQEKQDAIIQERINRLSMEGWELFQVVHAYGAQPRLYMRR